MLQSSSAQGRQFVVDIIKPGQLFGFAALLGLASERLDATTLTASRFATLDPPAFEKAVREMPEFGMTLIRYLMTRLQRRTQQVEDLVMLSFSSRLAKWLLVLAQEQDVRLDRNANVRCDFSQTLIAMLIGVSRETVSRQMQKWEDSGLLSHAGRIITLHDPSQLRRIADGLSEP